MAAPGDPPEHDARAALADLYAYSLAAPAAADGKAAGPAFAVHRLVQDFTRRGMDAARGRVVLEEALGWVDDAFVEDPGDVRNWPVLDPLAPHAVAVAERGDAAGVAEPTARIMGKLDLLFSAKARYPEAEPLIRRALALGEAAHGPNHSNVAILLNNLAQLLVETDRLTEAEPLLRRALAIKEVSYGPDHPNVAIGLNNLSRLLESTNRLAEAEPLMRRALAIFETSLGPEHPSTVKVRKNLASLLASRPQSPPSRW